MSMYADPNLSNLPVPQIKALARQVIEQAPPPTFERLTPSDIRVDAEYQRTLDQRRVDKMVREYNSHLLQPIEVSRRADGTLWCMEGQHRLAMVNSLGMQVIPAMVHEGLDSRSEAILFWLFQKVRKGLTAWDSFAARLHGGENVAVGVDTVCEELGLVYGRGGNHDIQALTVLESVYRQGGKTLLKRTLASIQNIWPVAGRRFDGSIISGLSAVFNQYGELPVFSQDRLELALSGVTPSSIVAEVRQARMYASSSSASDYGSAAVIRQLYNRRLGKNRQLPPLKGRDGKTLPRQGI